MQGAIIFHDFKILTLAKYTYARNQEVYVDLQVPFGRTWHTSHTLRSCILSNILHVSVYYMRVHI